MPLGCFCRKPTTCSLPFSSSHYCSIHSCSRLHVECLHRISLLWTLRHREWTDSTVFKICRQSFRIGYLHRRTKEVYEFSCVHFWYDMIWYDIYLAAIGLTPGGSSIAHIYTQVVHRIQRTVHRIQRTVHRIQRNITITKLNKHNNNILTNLWSAGRAPSLRVIPRRLPYNWGKSTENPQLG